MPWTEKENQNTSIVTVKVRVWDHLLRLIRLSLTTLCNLHHLQNHWGYLTLVHMLSVKGLNWKSDSLTKAERGVQSSLPTAELESRAVIVCICRKEVVLETVWALGRSLFPSQLLGWTSLSFNTLSTASSSDKMENVGNWIRGLESPYAGVQQYI